MSPAAAAAHPARWKDWRTFDHRQPRSIVRASAGRTPGLRFPGGCRDHATRGAPRPGTSHTVTAGLLARGSWRARRLPGLAPSGIPANGYPLTVAGAAPDLRTDETEHAPDSLLAPESPTRETVTQTGWARIPLRVNRASASVEYQFEKGAMVSTATISMRGIAREMARKPAIHIPILTSQEG